ncbi:RHS repeat-associated core domain-containing protein [Pantoea sp. BAV 3049]|uniref:RHS repeat-associated core domain-containing protein n=2 Tax=Pantoea sp. BAV 3049 TaxID=2654188 RepID=UPI001E54637F|nr:RHS repeat-associated core domain-containing protein [Pantoea sp. BAV 3049]
MTFTTAAGATRFIRHGHACLGVAGPAGLTLTAGGHNDSLLWSRNPASGSGQLHTWSPGGNGNATDGLPGFNGERPDPVSGSYHLGNGYRAYNPVLGRFNCPDSLSPFGAGGINPYAYCAGDPVNHTDPTGHISWQGIVGIIGGVIGLGLSLFTAGASIAAAGSLAAAWSSASATSLVVGGLGIAADVTGIASGATEDVNPEATTVLGWVSMATGLAGMVAGAALSPKGGKALKIMNKSSRSTIQPENMIINDIRAQLPINDQYAISHQLREYIRDFNVSSFSSEEHLLANHIKRQTEKVNRYLQEKIGTVESSSRKISVRFGHDEGNFIEYSIPLLGQKDYFKLDTTERYYYDRTTNVMNYINSSASTRPPLYRQAMNIAPPVPSYEMSMIPPPPLYTATNVAESVI